MVNPVSCNDAIRLGIAPAEITVFLRLEKFSIRARKEGLVYYCKNEEEISIMMHDA